MTRSVRAVAMDYLARREHARAELHRKLALKGFSHDDIQSALNRLRDEGLQSDLRFAENYTHHRHGRGFGPVKIQQELQQHGVDADMAAQVIASLGIDWLAACEQVWQKKFGCSPKTPAEKAKQQRFLMQRGFQYQVSALSNF